MSSLSGPDDPEHDAEEPVDGAESSADAACAACGAELGVRGSFCPACGAWLSDRVAPFGG